MDSYYNEARQRSTSAYTQGKQIYQSSNPKIKIIGQNNLNQYHNLNNQFCYQIQQKPSFKLNEMDLKRIMNQSQYNYGNNIQKSSDRQQNTYVPNQTKNKFQQIFQPKTNQHLDHRICEEKSQVESRIRSVSQYEQPTQGLQNYQFHFSNKNSKIQQEIKTCNQNNNQNNPNYKTTYFKQTSTIVEKQDLQKNKESQINLFDSQINIIQINCYWCNQNINEAQYCLNCYHIYHIDCLKELIIKQIHNFQQRPFLSCICQIKIPRIPLIEASFNKKYQNELIQEQLKFIYQSKKKNFENCSVCNFFWVKDKNQNNQALKYCLCKDKSYE
ncbi:unnamed protein product [Paramecium sonneborni]|uniref:Uncharacterized protein n=1 Tax=Paramecium sonneborni TaxID=65129 RepID=A0A8S1LC14_9CILI|nr:unnamed protein product [Paramecium sonneborni]